MKRLLIALSVHRLQLFPTKLYYRNSTRLARFSSSRVNPIAPKIVCAGCGAGLQTRDIAAAGYIPTHRKFLELQKRSEEAIKEKSTGHPGTLSSHGCVCQRCFDAKNYGRLIPLSMPPETYRAYLDYLMNLPADKGSLLVLVLDVWDFHGSALSVALKSILNRRPPRPSMLVVINKADLLPSTVKQERVLLWARKELRKAAAAAAASGMTKVTLSNLSNRGSKDGVSNSNLQEPNSINSDSDSSSDPFGYVSPPRRGRNSDIFARDDGKDNGGIVGVRLVSAQKGWGMFTLLDEIEKLHKGRDIFVIGAPNVGKSSVINALLSRRWNLPWTASGKPRLSPHERSNASSLGHSKTVTVFVDELPEGHKLGDTYKGDINELKAKVKERAMLLNSSSRGGEIEEGSNVSERVNPGDPVRRRGDEYGSIAPVNSKALSIDEDALTTAALAEYRARKAKHKSYKDEASIPPEITNGIDSTTLTTSTSSSSSNSIVTLSSSTTPPASSTASGRGGITPPEIPFTTSPLPGTTLGVIGAPFDSAGNAFLYDTPGIIGDPHKQRLLEGIAWEVEAARLAEETRERNERMERDERKNISGKGSRIKKAVLNQLDVAGNEEKESSNRSSTSSTSTSSSLQSSLSVLSLLVPSKKPSLQLIRLRPGRCMYLAGLARIEWSHPDPNCHILLTVCVSSGLSVHVTSSERADQAFAIASAFDAENIYARNHLPALEKDGLARGAGGIGTSSSPSSAASTTTNLELMNKNTDAEIIELSKTSGLSRILWPRWGALTQTARLRLIDCVASSTEKASINKLLTSDRLATNGFENTVASMESVEGREKRLERLQSEGFESFLTLDDDNEEEQVDDEQAVMDINNTARTNTNTRSTSRLPLSNDESKVDGEEKQKSHRRLPPHAVMPGASQSETSLRRRVRQRRALADVALSGLGWIAITPIEIEGQSGWARTVGHGLVSVKSALGVSIQLRAPLLPFEAAGTKPKDWKETGTS